MKRSIVAAFVFVPILLVGCTTTTTTTRYYNPGYTTTSYVYTGTPSYYYSDYSPGIGLLGAGLVGYGLGSYNRGWGWSGGRYYHGGRHYHGWRGRR